MTHLVSSEKRFIGSECSLVRWRLRVYCMMFYHMVKKQVLSVKILDFSLTGIYSRIRNETDFKIMLAFKLHWKGSFHSCRIVHMQRLTILELFAENLVKNHRLSMLSHQRFSLIVMHVLLIPESCYL